MLKLTSRSTIYSLYINNNYDHNFFNRDYLINIKIFFNINEMKLKFCAKNLSDTVHVLIFHGRTGSVAETTMDETSMAELVVWPKRPAPMSQ